MNINVIKIFKGRGGEDVDESFDNPTFTVDVGAVDTETIIGTDLEGDTYSNETKIAERRGPLGSPGLPGEKGEPGRDGLDGTSGVQGPPGHVFMIPVKYVFIN